MFTRLMLIIAIATLTGCAAPWVLSSQTVSIIAVDADTNVELKGAVCEITDKEGKKYIARPGLSKVMIRKGLGPLDFECRKPGYKQVAIGAGESFEKIDSFEALLFLPGVVLKNLFALPQYVFKYPSHVVIKMARK